MHVSADGSQELGILPRATAELEQLLSMLLSEDLDGYLLIEITGGVTIMVIAGGPTRIGVTDADHGLFPRGRCHLQLVLLPKGYAHGPVCASKPARVCCASLPESGLSDNTSIQVTLDPVTAEAYQIATPEEQ